MNITRQIKKIDGFWVVKVHFKLLSLCSNKVNGMSLL